MTRQNTLNGRWFIDFKKDEAESAGRIIGEVADGWFYVHLVNAGLTVTERLVVPVTEMKTFRFYNSDTEMARVRRELGKPFPPRNPKT